jgi:hypothetical protein
MLYRPKRQNKMWDTWLYYHEGKHYLYYLYMLTGPGDGIGCAVSEDGVHFREIGSVVEKDQDATWLGTGSIWKVRDRFVMNFSQIRQGVQSINFAVSKDLINWTRLPEEYDCHPDPRWYDNTATGRWDCITTLPRKGGGMWGVLTARPWPAAKGMAYESMGMVESEDGLHWKAVPPPPFDWNPWPNSNVHEPVGLEEIDGKYYVLMGLGMSADNLGSRHAWTDTGSHIGMYTFVAHRPEGPYRPDFGAYTLFRSNNTWFEHARASFRNTAWCARFYRTPGELLIHDHAINVQDLRWLAPLKKAITTRDGALEMGYWEGNSALKGKSISVDLAATTRIMPLQNAPDGRKMPTDHIAVPVAVADRLEIDEPYSGGVQVLSHHFDLEKGVLLEGTLTVTPADRGWAGVGLYFEEIVEANGTSTGAAIVFETRGRTELGKLVQGLKFTPYEIIERGISASTKTRLVLLLRKGMVEAYLDGIHVQSFSIPVINTGRLGLVFEGGRAVFEGLNAWEMSLDI